MQEPHRSRFVDLVRRGASTRDIHDSEGLGSYDRDAEMPSAAALVARELSRVEAHRRTLAEPLRALDLGRVERILDVGCGTGGSTVALATAWPEASTMGVDASALTLEAARVRAEGHGLDEARVRFLHVRAGAPLPLADGAFDLVTCVSVLEFVSEAGARERFARELLRVLRPGGHAFVATPTPFRLREHHSRRWLGNVWRRPGYPWSSPPWQVHAMFRGATPCSLAAWRLERHRVIGRLVPRRGLRAAAPAVAWLFPWQHFLFRKDGSTGVAGDPSG